MKLEDIHSLWAEDCQFDKLEPGNSAIELAKFHSKYVQILSNERMRLYRLESQLKALRLEKYEFYVNGPNEEQVKAGWKLPPKGRILKTEAKEYVEADQQIMELTLIISYTKEKIDTLTSILDMIKTMGFQIRNYIEWEKFKSGA